MEYLILATIITSFILQALLTRHFIQELSKKLVGGRVMQTKTIESPNQIEQVDDGSVEFSESTPLDLPKDLKVELEGNDMTPPEFADIK